MLDNSTWKQNMVVVSCMVLHNFIRKHDNEDSNFAHFDHDSNFVQTILERYNRYKVILDDTAIEAWMTLL